MASILTITLHIAVVLDVPVAQQMFPTVEHQHRVRFLKEYVIGKKENAKETNERHIHEGNSSDFSSTYVYEM